MTIASVLARYRIRCYMGDGSVDDDHRHRRRRYSRRLSLGRSLRNVRGDTGAAGRWRRGSAVSAIVDQRLAALRTQIRRASEFGRIRSGRRGYVDGIPDATVSMVGTWVAYDPPRSRPLPTLESPSARPRAGQVVTVSRQPTATVDRI